jgi:hypothetical protein
MLLIYNSSDVHVVNVFRKTCQMTNDREILAMKPALGTRRQNRLQQPRKSLSPEDRLRNIIFTFKHCGNC